MQRKQIDVEKFLEGIPDPDQIRARIANNAREISVLKRVLKLSEDAHAGRRNVSAAE
jgi:hypothetical protein